VNWNLGTSHFPDVCWKGWKESDGRREKSENLTLIASFLFLAFNLWSAYWALPARSVAKNGGGYYIYSYCTDIVWRIAA
jgi:hypothetical protein